MKEISQETNLIKEKTIPERIDRPKTALGMQGSIKHNTLQSEGIKKGIKILKYS